MSIKEKLAVIVQAFKSDFKRNNTDARVEIVNGKIWIEIQCVGLAD